MISDSERRAIEEMWNSNPASLDRAPTPGELDEMLHDHRMKDAEVESESRADLNRWISRPYYSKYNRTRDPAFTAWTIAIFFAVIFLLSCLRLRH